jgi:hypothetical protein
VSEDLVVINDVKIQDLADEILLGKQQKQSQRKVPNEDGSNNESWIEWDEEEWHYTGKNFEGQEIERKERVALYLLALDAINFCFWPPQSYADTDGDGTTTTSATNPMEYEHLAQALKHIAELDHRTKKQQEEAGSHGEDSVSISCYELNAENLARMTESKFLKLVGPYFESLNTNVKKNGDIAANMYYIPNISKRVELLREVGAVLLEKFNGSTLRLIQTANGDASKLVELIATSFPGFRDEVLLESQRSINDIRKNMINGTIDGSSSGTPSQSPPSPRRIVFLKRAQILVGDWNAALKLNLDGMDRLTTFADYRVPQILRHKDVLEYHPTLAELVDSNVELKSESIEEISIRAATVVAVQRLVRALNDKKIDENSNTSCGGDEGTKEPPFTDVTVDWYLWQVGEKMNNEGQMKPFHRVRTHFY